MIEAHLERAVLPADLTGLQELDDEQWQELGDLAVTEGLEGLLYHRCASEGVEVPAEATIPGGRDTGSGLRTTLPRCRR